MSGIKNTKTPGISIYIIEAIPRYKVFSPSNLLVDEARLCLASLSPTDQKILWNRFRTKYDLACQWLLALPAFETWENGDCSDLLYITANAGCGKTTIAAHVLTKADLIVYYAL